MVRNIYIGYELPCFHVSGEDPPDGYPNAEIRWFASPADGWLWIRGRLPPQAKSLAKFQQQLLDSPRRERIRANSPYAVPSSPRSARHFDREPVIQASRKTRPSLSDIQVPGAFPHELDVSLSELDDSDLEDDDERYEYLDHKYNQSIEDSFLLSKSDVLPPVSRAAIPNEEDKRSISSYGNDYPLDDPPLEDLLPEDLAYKDSSTPTPPSSSQFDYSQPERNPTLPFASLPAPDTPDHHSSESSATDISSSDSSVFGIAAPEFPLNNTQHGPPNPPLEKIELSDEQKDVLRRVLAGESLFFTGSAGTGKSVLLREIIRALTRPTDDVAVTASTGIAALNIGGKTLHSFAGVGLGKQHISILIKRVRNNDFVRHRWLRTTTLIVDEISMVDGDWFDTLEAIARSIRCNNKPFGGIQLVLCGDFFQLPPVDEQDLDVLSPGRTAKFAFEGWSWHACVPRMITLTQVFRQKEPTLIRVLNEMRVGEISEDTCELFHSLSRPLAYDDGIAPMELFPRRLSVELSNKDHLDILPGKLFKFIGKDSFYHDAANLKITPSRGRTILDRIVLPCVELKAGAQVMCVKNLGGDAKLVNGSIGKVVGFMIPLDARNSKKRESNTSSQSHPYTSIVGDLEPSRDLDPKNRDHNQPNFVYEGTKWPVVEYVGGHRVMMGPSNFTSERITDGEVQAERLQVPLILAWALTVRTLDKGLHSYSKQVHKSQGQTLDRVKVDLRGTFESGQAYVALSRCTSLEGLEVHNFSPRVVMANRKVLEWSRHPDSSSPILRPAPKYQRPVRQPAPPLFGRFKDDPQGFQAALLRTSRGTRSSDDEEELAARMYHGYDS